MFWFWSNQSPLTVTEELHIIRFVAVLHYAGEKFNIEVSDGGKVSLSYGEKTLDWAA